MGAGGGRGINAWRFITYHRPHTYTHDMTSYTCLLLPLGANPAEVVQRGQRQRPHIPVVFVIVATPSCEQGDERGDGPCGVEPSGVVCGVAVGRFVISCVFWKLTIPVQRLLLEGELLYGLEDRPN